MTERKREMSRKLKWLRRGTVAAGVLSGFSLFMNFGFEKVLSWYLTQKLKVSVDTSQASSIGIIGGADGPTAIFVASTNAHFEKTLGIIISVLLVLLTVTGALLCRKTRKEQSE